MGLPGGYGSSKVFWNGLLAEKSRLIEHTLLHKPPSDPVRTNECRALNEWWPITFSLLK